VPKSSVIENSLNYKVLQYSQLQHTFVVDKFFTWWSRNFGHVWWRLCGLSLRPGFYFLAAD